MAMWPKSITIDFSPGSQNGQECSAIDLQRHSTEEITYPGVDLPLGIHLGLFSPQCHHLLPYLCHSALRDKTKNPQSLPVPQ